MNGLNQVRDAVLEALRRAGVAAVPAFEGAAKRYPGAVAAVDVAVGAGRAAGLGGYLGRRGDAEQGLDREVYGMQLETEITLSVRAERAAECETAMETAAQTLLRGLPSGLRLEKMSWSGIAWDRTTGMFVREGKAACRAVFLAEDDGGEGELLDFILKGTMRR